MHHVARGERQHRCCRANKRKKCEYRLGSGTYRVSAGGVSMGSICSNDGQMVDICPGDQYLCVIEGEKRYCCKNDPQNVPQNDPQLINDGSLGRDEVSQ